MIDDFQVISDNIKSLREKRGLTQEELAELAGISVSHLSKIEANIRRVGMKTYIRLLNILTGTEDKEFFAMPPSSELQFEIRHFLKIIDDCNPLERKMLLSSLEGLKKGLRECCG